MNARLSEESKLTAAVMKIKYWKDCCIIVLSKDELILTRNNMVSANLFEGGIMSVQLAQSPDLHYEA